MTPAQIDALGEVATDAQLITLYRYALANGWAGTSRQINGRMVTFAQPGALLDLIERLEARVAAEDDEDDGSYGGVALAVFGTPR